MTYEPKSILLGVTILIVLGFLLVYLFTLIYQKLIIKVPKIDFGRLALSSLFVSLGWLPVMAVSIWAAGSVSVWIFGLVAFTMIAASLYAVTEKLFEIKGSYRIIYSISLALILNPVWFVVLGTV